MSGRRVLSVASEIFPLVKTGGLADVVGALPPALAREGIEVRTLVPGYPAVMAAIADAETVHVFPDLHGGPARLVAGRAADLDLFAARRPAPVRATGEPLSRGGWQGVARQRAALRGTRAMRGGDGSRRRPVLRAADRARARLAGRTRTGVSAFRSALLVPLRDDRPQPRVPGPVPARALAGDRTSARLVRCRWRRILRHDRLSQGRPRARRSRDHRVTDLCRGNPDGRGGDGARRPPAPARQLPVRHSQRDRRDGVEPRDGPAPRRALRCASAARARSQQDGVAVAPRPGRRATRVRIRRREPAHVAERHRRAHRGAARAASRRRAARRPRRRRRDARARALGRVARARGARRRHARVRRGPRPPDPGRDRRAR